MYTTYLGEKNSYGYLQQKVGKSQKVSGTGCLKIFGVKGKNNHRGGGGFHPHGPYCGMLYSMDSNFCHLNLFL